MSTNRLPPEHMQKAKEYQQLLGAWMLRVRSAAEGATKLSAAEYRELARLSEEIGAWASCLVEGAEADAEN